MGSKLFYYWKMKMFTERVTSLENFSLCPLKFDKVKFDGNNIETFIAVEIWTIVHLWHQYPEMAHIMCDVFFDHTLPAITWQRSNIKKEQLHNIIELSKQRIEEFKDNTKYFEVKNTVVINGMIVTWSYDCLVHDDDWELHLFDFKTAGNIDYYKNRIEKKQIMIYAYMIMQKMGIDKLKVSYQIYIKGKDNTKATVARKTKVLYKNKCWLINQIDYIDDIEKKVFNIIDNYKLSKEMDMYWPKPLNEDWSACSACRYCKLRNWDTASEIWQDICPAMTNNASIDFNWEIEF